CNNAALRATVDCNVGYQLRIFHSGRIDRDFISAAVQQGLNVLQFTNATTNGEGDRKLMSDSFNEMKYGFPLFMRSRNIKEHQFISTSLFVSLRQFDGTPHVAQVSEIDTFDGAAICNVQAGDDSMAEVAN